MADLTRKEVERRVKHRDPLKEKDLTGMQLDDFDFEGAIFNKCKFTRSSFKGSIIAFSRFEECLLDDCEMQDCIVQESSFNKCDFSKSDLRDSVFIETNFRQAVLHSTDFSGAFLKDCVMIEIDGDLCNFSFATMSDSNLNGAKLHICDFSACRAFGIKAAGSDFYRFRIRRSSLGFISAAGSNIKFLLIFCSIIAGM